MYTSRMSDLWQPQLEGMVGPPPSVPVAPSEWDDCERALRNIPSMQDELGDSIPNAAAIATAWKVLSHLRRTSTIYPPSLITTEPGGGLVIERRFDDEQAGGEWVLQFTIYNAKPDKVEFTRYRNTKVVEMTEYSIDALCNDAAC